jgi:hypothetical protein
MITRISAILCGRIRSCPAAARLDAGGSRDRARGRGITGDLGPRRRGPTPAEPPRSSATVKIAQGKGTQQGNRQGTGTGQWPKGPNRRTPDRGKPEEGGGRGEPGGQTGNRRQAHRGNRRTCGEAPDHPVRIRGFGAARIYNAAGTVLAGRRVLRIAHSGPPAFWRARSCVSRAPQALHPRECRPAPSAVC